MRIAHIVYTPRLSGAEVLVSLLAPMHMQHGNISAIFSLNALESNFSALAAKLSAKGVPLFFPEKSHRLAGRVLFLRHALSSFRPDIIFAHSIIPSAYARLASMVSTKVPVITVLHDATCDDYHVFLYRILEKFLMPAPISLIAVANKALVNYSRRISSKIPGIVIENAIDLEGLIAAQESRLEKRKTLGIRPDEIAILAIGRLSPQKCHHLLIQAFASLAEDIKRRCRLIIVGIKEDVEYEKRLRSAAAGLGDRVLFCIDRPDSLNILACADVFCMPSISEAFSLAFLEGLALGVPVVASRIDAFQFAECWEGVRLIEQNNRTELTAALLAAINNQCFAYTRPVEQFRPDKIARRYENVGHKALETVSI